MRLLDRYLLRGLCVPLAYCLGGLLVIYVAFDLIFRINAFQEKLLNLGDMAQYYAATLPEILVMPVVPVSLLLALLYALTTHSRHNELTAMRTAGVGLWRLSAPFFAVAIVLGLAVLAMNELLVPPSEERAGEILRRHDPNAISRDWISQLNFFNDGEGRHWQIDKYNRATSEMIAPHIFFPGDHTDGRSRWITADRGIYTNGQWLFFNVVGIVSSNNESAFFNVEDWLLHTPPPTNASPPAGVKPSAVLAIPLSETPAWINSELKVRTLRPEDAAKKPQLSLQEIRAYVRLHPHQEAADRAKLMTQYHCRLAEPFTCLAVVLIALPFGARVGRQNVFAGVASSIFICFGYFFMQRFAMGMGVGEKLPPVLAAWLPNLVFGVTGLVMICRAR
jgi:lipopolysaccharide export system permease protein